MSNELRMPLAEWLFLMSEEDVPYQARTLAIYAACFDVTGNQELSQLCGMVEPSGGASRTFEKWKKLLKDNGWVALQFEGGGRARKIIVHPAYKETPVTFTDVSKRNPRKFDPRKKQQTGAEITPVYTPETVAKVTPVLPETGVISAGVFSRDTACVPAHLETPSGLVISQKVEDKSPLTPLSFSDPYDRVKKNGDVLELANGLGQFWLKQFGDDQISLDLALMEIAADIQPNSRTSMEKQVSAKLARIVRQRRDSDTRYARVVRENKTASKNSTEVESPSERRARLLAAARQEGKR